jgi:hypothetical protein
MKRIIALLGLIFLFSMVLAQGQNRMYIYSESGTIRSQANTVFADEQTGLEPSCLDAPNQNPRNITDKIDGYPFLVPGWGKGIILIDEKELACDKLNLFFYNQQMWIKLDNDIMNLEPRENIEAVIIEGKRMVGRIMPKGDGKPCWVEELEAGPSASVYKHYTSKFTPAIAPRNSYDDGNKASFINKGSLYVRIDGGALQELPEKNAAFLALFSQNADKMKQFISANKINLKKEEDVLRAISYYNAL